MEVLDYVHSGHGVGEDGDASAEVYEHMPRGMKALMVSCAC